MGYIECFERLALMMENIGNHLSYLSEYSKPPFQESEKLQEVRCNAWLFFVNTHMQREPMRGMCVVRDRNRCSTSSSLAIAHTA